MTDDKIQPKDTRVSRSKPDDGTERVSKDVAAGRKAFSHSKQLDSGTGNGYQRLMEIARRRRDK